MKKSLVILLLSASLLSGCGEASVSGVVTEVSWEQETISAKEYNIEVCKPEQKQVVIDILDNIFSETSKAYFTGNDWKIVVTDSPIGSGIGFIQSGKCDYQSKTITVYDLDLEASLKHEIGHYYSYIYKTYIKQVDLGDEEQVADTILSNTEIKEAVDNFNAVVQMYSIEEVDDTLRGLNKSSDFLATSEVDINELIELCSGVDDRLRGAVADSYYIILTSQKIETDNPHYIVVDRRLPLDKQIEKIRSDVYGR